MPTTVGPTAFAARTTGVSRLLESPATSTDCAGFAAPTVLSAAAPMEHPPKTTTEAATAKAIKRVPFLFFILEQMFIRPISFT